MTQGHLHDRRARRRLGLQGRRHLLRDLPDPRGGAVRPPSAPRASSRCPARPTDIAWEDERGRWHTESPGRRPQDDWTNGLVKALAVLLADVGGAAALVLSNAAFEDVDFALPDPGGRRNWRLRLDSATGAIDPDAGPAAAGSTVSVPARSIRVYSA